MRGFVPAYDVVSPSDLTGALKMLADAPELRPLAGGTDVMVLLEEGHLPVGRFMNIWGLNALRGIEIGDDEVKVGALTTYRDVIRTPIFAAEYPMMVEAARLSGAAAIQNRGTLGGNIVNGSPAADSPPAMVVYEVDVELTSVRGVRRVPYVSFHRGYKVMDRAADELLTAIYLPRKPGGANAHHIYRKVGTRRAQAISKVVFAGLGVVDDGVITTCRMALGSVAATVVRCPKAEAALTGMTLAAAAAAAAELVSAEVTPIDDVRSTAEYRKAISGRLAADFVRQMGA